MNVEQMLIDLIHTLRGHGEGLEALRDGLAAMDRSLSPAAGVSPVVQIAGARTVVTVLRDQLEANIARMMTSFDVINGAMQRGVTDRPDTPQAGTETDQEIVH